MRFALIMAGGSGTRLWPMSRVALPKQLIPFIETNSSVAKAARAGQAETVARASTSSPVPIGVHRKSLLRIAWERFEGLLSESHRYICAGLAHRDAVLSGIPGLSEAQFLGEPMGRDTLGAVGFGAAVLAVRDPEAVIGVFTADHLIEPVDLFQRIIVEGFSLVEQHPNTLVTFGITPTGPATGYGYLELGATLSGQARVVSKFQEKPPLETAQRYLQAGPQRYLWNSGMFVWRASTLLDCIRRYEPAVYAGLMEIAESWETSERDEVIARVYSGLKKISVDFAVMEPASRDPAVRVAAISMPLSWVDVGSWPAFAGTCRHDERGNALAAARHLLLDTENCLVASDNPEHLVAAIGCRDLVVVHTADATLICRADMAEKIKDLHKLADAQFDGKYT